MKNKYLRIAAYAISLAVFLVTVLIYGKLPEQIPTNWGFDGKVQYGNKSVLWMITGMQIFLAWLLDLMPRIDPRRKNYEKFGRYYDSFCVFMQVFLAVTWGIVVAESFRPGMISVEKVITVLCGLLFLFVGNMLPKVKSNFYVGIKTPWTLSDDEIWARANILGGKTMSAAGIAIMAAGLFVKGRAAVAVILAAVIISCFIPVVMSYVWWRRKNG